MYRVLASLIKWFFCTAAILLTIFLLYTASDYPCTWGAGLALADLEAFLLLTIVAFPCFVWAIRQLFIRSRPSEQSIWGRRWITYFAEAIIVGVIVFAFVAIPVVFSVRPHPLQFICRDRPPKPSCHCDPVSHAEAPTGLLAATANQCGRGGIAVR